MPLWKHVELTLNPENDHLGMLDALVNEYDCEIVNVQRRIMTPNLILPNGAAPSAIHQILILVRVQDGQPLERLKAAIENRAPRPPAAEVAQKMMEEFHGGMDDSPPEHAVIPPGG